MALKGRIRESKGTWRIGRGPRVSKRGEAHKASTERCRSRTPSRIGSYVEDAIKIGGNDVAHVVSSQGATTKGTKVVI